jgi:hypothetical protein
MVKFQFLIIKSPFLMAKITSPERQQPTSPPMPESHALFQPQWRDVKSHHRNKIWNTSGNLGFEGHFYNITHVFLKN